MGKDTSVALSRADGGLPQDKAALSGRARTAERVIRCRNEVQHLARGGLVFGEPVELVRP